MDSVPKTPLIIHHLNESRSQRIIWLLEELNINYEVKKYYRNPVSKLSPPEIYSIHPLGKFPIITDGDLVIAETGAIVEYLIENFDAESKFKPREKHERVLYNYYLHMCEGSLMLPLLVKLFRSLEPSSLSSRIDDKMTYDATQMFNLIEDQLSKTEYIAGRNFSAADIILSFPIQNSLQKEGLGKLIGEKTRKWVAKITDRSSYKKALEVGGGQNFKL
ncbi:hypothetical protein HDU92_006439 [Lobulomyces angularis]|nr:hypothetical protein HDU92_006439 [Lobulomyces angularis]